MSRGTSPNWLFLLDICQTKNSLKSGCFFFIERVFTISDFFNKPTENVILLDYDIDVEKSPNNPSRVGSHLRTKQQDAFIQEIPKYFPN